MKKVCKLKLWLRLPRPVGQSLAILVVHQVWLPSPEVLAVLDGHGLVDEGPDLLQPGLGALHNLIGILNMERVTWKNEVKKNSVTKEYHLLDEPAQEGWARRRVCRCPQWAPWTWGWPQRGCSHRRSGGPRREWESGRPGPGSPGSSNPCRASDNILRTRHWLLGYGASLYSLYSQILVLVSQN